VSWGLYSNFARKWAGQAESGAVPLFLLASGIVLAAIRPAFAEHSHWQLRAVLELLFLALVPSLLGYVFWDVAVRKGRMMLVVSASYVIPLLSTIISCAYLRVAPGVWLWVGCALVIGGAVICKFSVSGE
jgi:drug/metabolite transporter (DMT)-like permease